MAGNGWERTLFQDKTNAVRSFFTTGIVVSDYLDQPIKDCGSRALLRLR
jgi:hypothetical protein